MKNVFITCSAKEFYEVLKPLLLTLEGYKCHSDEWIKTDEGCRIDAKGNWFPYGAVGYEEVDLADFIAAVKPKATVTASEMTDDEFKVFCAEIRAGLKQVGEMIEAYETKHNGANLKPQPTFDPRGFFIPCTEEQHKEVYQLLRKLGYRQWDDEAHGWRDYCEGVTLGKDGAFFCYTINGRPTLTLEELREIAKNVKP
jgi:hypothetical protein